ncbi:MAG: transporter substrate-binding domain-containing protein [Clostridia bacterium]|nr:transporter substrate-binding domain-containing protein [Clostridia bacterium]
MKMKKLFAVLMAVLMVALCFSACGGNQAKVVVAEAGSAGETVMNEDKYFAEFTKTPVDAQATALMEVKSGTADMAVIDYVMSIGSIGEGTDYADLKLVEDVSFAPEEYGIAFRKGSDVVNYVNKAINELKADGTLDEIAKKYKLQDLLLGDSTFEEVKAEESDWEYIQKKGELVVGITLFAPMNYNDENGELVGFETEFAKAVGEKLGVEIKFQVIEWNSKEAELASKNIDCIWNGMTITPEREENMQISIPYMENKQAVVVKAD